ncbi:MAG TPA: hypothetical protein PKY82_32935 [Pyrinomonadaceae bacterium]|nr:hypothetical protein [Pyrinomonadaceae bacterium]
MILAILFAWFGYKKANANGRNGILWAIIAAGTFITTQFLVALGVGSLIAFTIGVRGGNERDYDSYTIPITIIAIIASVISGFLVLRYLDKVPENTKITPPPPPPTNFN